VEAEAISHVAAVAGVAAADAVAAAGVPTSGLRKMWFR
jgi:hypothetical protein